MLRVEIVGDKALVQRLAAMPPKVRQALSRAVRILALKLQTHVKQDKLSGQVLQVRTGALRSSIFYQMKDTPTEVSAIVAAPRDVPYAAIHEFGGRTPAHVIEPKNAKALHFQIDGKDVFARRVNHPGSVLKERSYLRSSLKDMQDEIRKGLEGAVREGLGLR
jgi:phage gpG-like protein